MRQELADGCVNVFRPLLQLVQPGWIAGGAVRDFFSRMPAESDIDVFFPDAASLANVTERLKQDEASRLLYENAATIGFLRKGKHIQLVRRHFFAGPQETIAEFDFTVCCCAVSLDGVFVHEHFFDDLAGRRLAINRLPFPLSTLERLQRYVAKGFLACNGTLLELTRGLQAVDLQNPAANVLEFYPGGGKRFVRFD